MSNNVLKCVVPVAALFFLTHTAPSWAKEYSWFADRPVKAPTEKNIFDTALQAYEEGYREYREGHFYEAEEKLKEALSLEPNLIKAHYWLGKLYREMGMLKEAVFHEEEVLHLKKVIHDRRIALSYENNEYPAVSQIEIIRAREKTAEEAFTRGKRFLDEGHWDGAIAEFKTAATLYPANKDYLLMLARILWDRLDVQGAAKYYMDLLELKHLEKPWIIEAIDRAIYAGNKTWAIRHLRKLTAEFPTESEYATRLASLEDRPALGTVSMGKVIRRLHGQVVLDFGLDRGLKLADEYTLGLRVFRPGDPILEPTSGKELGRTPDRTSGTVLVTKVFSNSCWGLIQQEFDQGVKAGDLIEVKSPVRR